MYDFNLPSNREFLRHIKALKVTFGRCPLLLKKYKILPKRRKKQS